MADVSRDSGTDWRIVVGHEPDTVSVTPTKAFSITARGLACLSALLIVSCADSTATHEGDESPGAGDSREEELARMADEFGLENPPHVDLVREVTPAEGEIYFDQCMREEGWNLDWRDEYTVPEEQVDAFLLSEYICHAQFPLREEFLQPLDNDQWKMLYDHWVSKTLPCFKYYGLTVADNVPSRDAFLDNPTSWQPNRSVTDDQVQLLVVDEGFALSLDDFYINVCPGPDEDVLYGVDL